MYLSLLDFLLFIKEPEVAAQNQPNFLTFYVFFNESYITIILNFLQVTLSVLSLSQVTTDKLFSNEVGSKI